MVIVTAAFTTIERAFVAVELTLSVTLTVKLEVPAAVAVPVMAPVPATSDRPEGRLPEDIAHV